ncbi:hypothetical protein [Puniceibacterium sp. IMCC21224]|uniref:hypothetical protein n=1 Tax=Puniceibacterium sp. IMCC21224 TaxID=1618204 RepID=UPI001E42C444|nr:hypothetical protein [Puniceibacterium sp. IMCC21224]
MPSQTMVVEDSAFVLRINGPLVEATRTNPEFLPKFPQVARKAGLAAHRATGCTPRWIRGDPAMMIVGLSCDGARPPPKPKRRVSFYCDVLDIDLGSRAGLGRAGLECYKG